MPRSKSLRSMGGPAVDVEIWSRRTQERVVVSPVGVQALLSAVHNRLFCQTGLFILLSPVFRSFASAGWPGWSALGGKPGGAMGTVFTATATGPGGVPAMVYTFMPAPVEGDVAQAPTMSTIAVVSQFSAK